MGDRRLEAMREKGWIREHQPARVEIETHLQAARAYLDAADVEGVPALPRFTRAPVQPGTPFSVTSATIQTLSDPAMTAPSGPSSRLASNSPTSSTR